MLVNFFCGNLGVLFGYSFYPNFLLFLKFISIRANSIGGWFILMCFISTIVQHPSLVFLIKIFLVFVKIFQSASLCLTTTTPEQLASALWWFMHPLSLFGVSVDEVILTLLLSLRFINLVFDEESFGTL